VKALVPSQMDFDDANEQFALWSEPDESALDSLMHEIVENYPQALAKARQGRDYLVQYTWKSAVEQMMERA
jgi:spermidine/putrescine-binding protein